MQLDYRILLAQIEKKWTFRKEALEQLQPICETPKIEKGEFHDIVSGIVARSSSFLFGSCFSQVLSEQS